MQSKSLYIKLVRRHIVLASCRSSPAPAMSPKMPFKRNEMTVTWVPQRVSLIHTEPTIVWKGLS